MLGDPFVGAGVEQVEGQGSTIEHRIVEGAEVELGSQFFLGTVAEFAKLELAKLVAKSLRGPRDVAIGFGLDGGLVDRARLPDEIHALVTFPTLSIYTH